MALTNYNSLIEEFNGFYSWYVDEFEQYNNDTYNKEIDDDFQQIKIPMGEIIEQIKISLLLSHTCSPTLTQEQIIAGRKALKKFEIIHDKHREMLAMSSQLKLKTNIDKTQSTVDEVTELKEKIEITITNLKTTRKNILDTTKDVNDIKGNLFGIFSFMVGFLGFIFINFNIFSKLGDLSINKAIATVLLLNTSFVSGIVILMKLFKDMLFYRNEDKNHKFWIWFLVIYGLINLFLIIFLSFVPTIKYWVFSFFI